MNELVKKKCVPCENSVPPLEGKALFQMGKELGGDWMIVNDHHLEKVFSFKNFKEALQFANRVGELAESEGHHPDLHVSWGKVRILIWTHNINGLSENDFILASKIDVLLS